MKPDIPKFETKKELFAWLKEHNEDIIYQKKASFKRADSFDTPTGLMIKEFIPKVMKGVNDENSIKVRAIINTTYIKDSHDDVHIDDIWKQSLKQNKRIKHIQEHQMAFDKVISDKGDLRAFTKMYEWRELGYDVDGKTQALVFDSVVKQERNPVMYKEYKQENVDNHSVGMYYVNVKLAMNSDDEGDEKYKDVYDKHIDRIANKDQVAKDGFFYAVYEAKAIEGSAVINGSNPITPTYSTSKTKEEIEVEIQQTKNDEMAKVVRKWLKE